MNILGDSAQVRLLETGLRATACCIVRSGSDSQSSAATAPEVTVDEPGEEMRAAFSGRCGPPRIAAAEALSPSEGAGGDCGSQQGCGEDGGRRCGGDESSDDGAAASDASDGGEGVRTWSPDEGAALLVSILGSDREAGLAQALAEQCHEALRAFPTTADEDERILSELRAAAAEGNGGDAFEGGEAAAAGEDASSGATGRQQEEEGGVRRRLRRKEHMELAVQLRLARKRLLLRAAEGLRLQAEVVGALSQ